MNTVDIIDVREKQVDDLCRVCVPADKMDDSDWVRGIDEKKKWAADMLKKWGSFAKVAYQDGTAVGMIQYRPIPEESVVRIDCIYVPTNRSTLKGTATRLLSSLIEDVRKPMNWFASNRPLALVTGTFDGGEPGQYTAREFFSRKGFRQIGEDPDHMYYPLAENLVYRPGEPEEAGYIAQEEDKGKVLLVCGPNGCPATYPFFLKRMERYIRQMCPAAPIRWLDASDDPKELTKRNVDVGDCVVNARRIETCVLDSEGFQREVTAALAQYEAP